MKLNYESLTKKFLVMLSILITLNIYCKNICKYCSFENEDSDSYCLNCAKQIQDPKPKQTKKQNYKTTADNKKKSKSKKTASNSTNIFQEKDQDGIVAKIQIYPPGTKKSSDQILVQGSAFLINKEGYFLTNHHVIAFGRKRRGKIFVRFDDHENKSHEYSAEVVSWSAVYDVAIIRCRLFPKNNNLKYYKFPPKNYEVKKTDIIDIIGSPFDRTGVVCRGIVSGFPEELPRYVFDLKDYKKVLHKDPLWNIFKKDKKIKKFIQLDANVNKGNSGGPIVNEWGEVIGIVTWKDERSENIGFGTHHKLIEIFAKDYISFSERSDEINFEAYKEKLKQNFIAYNLGSLSKKDYLYRKEKLLSKMGVANIPDHELFPGNITIKGNSGSIRRVTNFAFLTKKTYHVLNSKQHDSVTWIPDENIINKAKDSIFEYLRNNSKDSNSFYGSLLDDIDSYYSQVVGINKDNNKEIIFYSYPFIWGFESHYPRRNWKKKLLYKDNTKKSFWLIKYDIKDNKCYGLEQNIYSKSYHNSRF